MIQFQQQKGSLSRSRAGVLVAVLCLALLALLSVVQVAHIHPVNTDADHCSICVALHAAASVTAVAAAIVLVQLGASAPLVQSLRAGRPWSPTLFNRPPPASL